MLSVVCFILLWTFTETERNEKLPFTLGIFGYSCLSWVKALIRATPCLFFQAFCKRMALPRHCSELSRLTSVLCVLGFGSDSSPAVPQQALQDVRGPRRAEDRPLDASVFEVAAVDLVGTEPLFYPLLDAVPLGESHGARSRGEAVIHKVHSVLKQGWDRDSGGWGGKVIRVRPVQTLPQWLPFKIDSETALLIVRRKKSYQKDWKSIFKSCPKELVRPLKNKAFQTANASLKDTWSFED